MNNFYIYMVERPNGRPLYIGKGSSNRWKLHRARARTNAHYAAILKEAGGVLSVQIIAKDLTEAVAYELEGQLTRFIGLEAEGGPLVNCGHGGEGGPSGVVRSAAFRKRRSQRAKEAWRDPQYRTLQLSPNRNRKGNNHPRTEAFKQAVAAKMRGKTHSKGHRHGKQAKAKLGAYWDDPAWRSKIMAARHTTGMYDRKPKEPKRQVRGTAESKARKSALMAANWDDPIYRQKVTSAIRDACKIRVATEAQRQAVASANARRVISEETRRKMALSKTGVKQSAETIAKRVATFAARKAEAQRMSAD